MPPVPRHGYATAHDCEMYSVKKLKALPSHGVNSFRYLEPFRRAWITSVTNRRRDIMAFSKITLSDDAL